MTFPRSMAGLLSDAHPWRTSLILLAIVIAGMALLTLVFGVHEAGPSYQAVPDPAGLALPF